MESAIATATSEALLDVNWDVNMQITDSVLHGGLPAAQAAMAALRKRLSSKNPKAVQLALTVRAPAGLLPPSLCWRLLMHCPSLPPCPCSSCTTP
jgi:hypothetical protein